MARRYAIGDKVRLIRAVSVNHFRAAGMAISGVIGETRQGGYHNRNYRLDFPDRAGSWYASDEFTRIR